MTDMRKILVLITSLLFLFTGQAFGHHLWVTPADGGYQVARGIFGDRTDPYDPVCVKQINAYAPDGSKIPVQRSDQETGVIFSITSEKTPAIIAVTSEWGDRVNTTRGKKLINRKAAEAQGLTVISAFFSTQYSKTLFTSPDQITTPLGLKFEIVPLTDPLSGSAEEKPRFKLLFDGEPLANASVYTHDDREVETDENGIARIGFEKNGIRLIYAKHTTPAGEDSDLDYLQFMTFLIFEVQ